jgi:hypothetical protein
MGRWKFVSGPRDGSDPQAELTAATSRRVTFRLGEPADAAFSLDGRHEQALGITELATDLWCYRDRTLLFRGRIGTNSDDLTPDTHSCTFNAPDYRALLDRRFLHDTDKLSFVTEDQADIAWQLAQIAQGKTAGDLGITRGVGQSTGNLRSPTYRAGEPIGASIGQIGDVESGFDWEIDAQLRLNIFTPERGRATEEVLDYGGAVTHISRALAPSDYANAVRATADADPRAPEYREAADLATRPEGRFEASRGFPGILEQSTLAARATALLADAQVLRPSYTLTFKAGRYPGTEALWLGDTALVVIKSGRLNIADRLRVYEINFEPGQDGTETVKVTVGHPNPAGQFAARARAADVRLALLERR